MKFLSLTAVRPNFSVWQLSDLTAVRSDSCQNWQLSKWKILGKIFHQRFSVYYALSNWKISCFFCMQLTRSTWSSAGTLFLNKKHSILELIFRKLQIISKRPQPASFFFEIRNATFLSTHKNLCKTPRSTRWFFCGLWSTRNKRKKCCFL